MSTNDLWFGYAIIATILLTGYYLFIAYRFYRWEIRAFLTLGLRSFTGASRSRKNTMGPSIPEQNIMEAVGSDPVYTPPEPDEHPPPWQDEQLFRQVEELAADLKRILTESHKTKDDMINQVRTKICEFPSLRNSPFQFAINNLIEIECQRNGSIHLDTDDKAMIWQQVD